MPDLTGRTLGKYQVVRLLGQGGMATVYLAVDQARPTPVALKVLSPLLAENHTFLLRYQARVECRPAAEASEHRSPGRLRRGRWFAYLAMPYLEGGSLADRLRQGLLRPAEAQRVIGQVAATLHHAHDNGIALTIIFSVFGFDLLRTASVSRL